MTHRATRTLVRFLLAVTIPVFFGVQGARAQGSRPASCKVGGEAKDSVLARVVALDSPIFANRLGAQVPGGMIFALAVDVEPTDAADKKDWTKWNAGAVALKSYKRARPLVLRVNKNQCLQIEFRNLLAKSSLGLGDTETRAAGVFVQGMEWVRGPEDDASWVGANPNSLVDPGAAAVSYVLYAREEGPFLLYSTGDDFTNGDNANATTTVNDQTPRPPNGLEYPESPKLSPSGGDGGQLTQGMFGSVTVQPVGAEYYRSQVNAEDLCLASEDGSWSGGACKRGDPDSPPKINYAATYPANHPNRANLPVLRMTTAAGELAHSDLTAIITGPKAGMFLASDAGLPEFHLVGSDEKPTYPNRREPYREFTIIYHELLRSAQAFNQLYQDSQLQFPLEAGGDNFAINYGTGGIGSEILANRLEVGPMAECTDCKYEEFFLSSWPNGDPAMIVDVPADHGCSEKGNGFTTYDCADHKDATQAFYPDDPSNVYHTYLWDHTKFRVLHGGVDLHHLHHLHAHQWLHTPNTSGGHYLDSQAIGPGSAFTLETVFNGSGNKNLTVGDSIFHCHFYPHFAAGMWALWRVHDTFEAGTALQEYPNGKPAKGSRALPDGEIEAGTPIPGIVPLPTKPMAPEPAPVQLAENGTQVEVCKGTQSSPTDCISNLAASGGSGYENPGYPFFIPGIAGSRATHPPIDFALACSVTGVACDTIGASCGGPAGNSCVPLDGGLPRHIVESMSVPGTVVHAAALNPLDFSKDVESATAIQLPEEGTVIEQVAMKFHAQLNHPTVTPGGAAAQFRTNGQPPVAGAPYAEPCIDLAGKVPPQLGTRDYWAVDIQIDAVYNKEGWHYPQQRMISLWGDALDFMGLKGDPKPPEPFFFRANSYDCVKYRLANLVPKTYELDDFQVRTPTDVLGQHIHLVKFDVTSSDGAANGFNYEDGTLAPDEVVERINAFNKGSFLEEFGSSTSLDLKPKAITFFGANPGCSAGSTDLKCNCTITDGTVAGGRWCGAQATLQRWYVDPQLTATGQDRTMRTVFTHDHFSPSTHQQTGLYAGLVAEPFKSTWLTNESGSPLGNRTASENGQSVKDGGPTSWEAIIKTADGGDSYREFLLEFQDTTLMYLPFAKLSVPPCPPGTACGFCSTKLTQACSVDASSSIYYKDVCPSSAALPNKTAGDLPSALDASCNFIAGIPSMNDVFRKDNPVWGAVSDLSSLGWDTWPIYSPGGQPELISFSGGSGNFTVNYRNEPLYSRIASGSMTHNADDLAFVYQSLDRGLPPGPYARQLTSGVETGDPFTPLLRAYSGDDLQVRVLVGAHQNPHNFTLHGAKWLFEPSNVNSGWRNTQTMGISEHFEYLFKLNPPLKQPDFKLFRQEDYLYKTTAAKAGQRSGNWGLMRAYNEQRNDLAALPQNPMTATPDAVPICSEALLNATCDQLQPDGFFASAPIDGHRLRCYSVTAVNAEDMLGGTPLTYNTVLDSTAPNALLYMHLQDYEKLNAGNSAPGYDASRGLAEPLVLRAAAGDCIKVNLRSRIDVSKLGGGFSSAQVPLGLKNGQPNTGPPQTRVPSRVSANVGLHPQLVSYNVTQSDGYNAGLNPTQTAGPETDRTTYYWYAGNIDADAPAGQQHIPIEFGAANLMPADPMNQHAYSLFGGLIIEPEGSVWTTDTNSRTSATVKLKDGSSFREFVMFMQDDIVLQQSGNRQSNVGAVNYRIEPIDEFLPNHRECAVNTDVSCVLSNQAECDGGTCGFSADIPIQTPLYCAEKGQAVRMRLLHPGGGVTNQVFELHGHVFAEEPYSTSKNNCAPPITQANPFASQTIAVENQCPDNNLTLGPSITEWKAARMGHGPTNHFDVVVKQAGGENALPGDYLYRSYPAIHFRSGIWGIMRVTDGDPSNSPNMCPSFGALP